jgi:hypothetical protein
MLVGDIVGSNQRGQLQDAGAAQISGSMLCWAVPSLAMWIKATLHSAAHICTSTHPGKW